MPRAIVSGALANKPANGGNAWTRLSYVLGLARLGFDVVFVEQIEQPSTEAAEYFEAVCGRFGVDGELIVDGQIPDGLLDRAEGSDVLVNIGGHLTTPRLKEAARVAIFLDDDPGYTQFWYAEGALVDRLEGHDAYFTYGVNIGRERCPIPAGGITWKPARPPVVLTEWPRARADAFDRLTTVASWRGAYGRVAAGGRLFGQKAHEFRKLASLPSLVEQQLEIALQIDEADAADGQLLSEGGWRIVEPGSVAADPDAFRRYVQSSSGEVSAAQGIYVETESGWFSDRTAAYLASGKPSLIQDTGFNGGLPVGEGLIAFRTLDEAADGARRLARDYDAHADAARAIAERHLDSDVVLERMLDEAGLS